SMLALTRALLALRRRAPALTAGAYRPLARPGLPDDCYVFVRNAGSQELLVALNFADQDRRLHLEQGAGHLLLSTHLDRQGDVDLAALELRAAEGCVIELDRAG